MIGNRNWEFRLEAVVEIKVKGVPYGGKQSTLYTESLTSIKHVCKPIGSLVTYMWR